MRNFPTWPALTTTDIARGALTGAVAGIVSAVLRWVAFRYERDRRLAKLKALAEDTTSAVTDALEQTRKGLEHMVIGGKVTPFPPKGASDDLSVDTGAQSFEVPRSDLDQIFEDLNRYRGESGSA